MPIAAPDRRQPLLLALCAVTALLILLAFWMALNAYGDTGIHWEPSTTPYIERIAGIDPGSPGETAGLQIGDLLDSKELTPAQRLRFFSGEAAEAPITLHIRHDGMRRSVTLTPQSETKSSFWQADGWDQVLSIFGELWQVFVAGLLLWRRPKSAEVRLLAFILFLPQLGVAIAPGLNNWITPWAALDAVLYAACYPLLAGGSVLLATYALHFGRPISRGRRIATLTAYAFAGLTALAGSVAAIGLWFGFIDWPTWFFNRPVPSLALALADTVLPLVCAGLALRSAQSTERARLAWVVGSFSINYVCSFVFTVTSTTGLWTHVGVICVDVSTVLTPIGLTYAILSRRIVDVGFVLNRAAVFTMLSFLVVGAFSLVEWAIGGWLQSASKTTNLLVAAGLAMALGLSIHPIQLRVDRFVDGVFFRKRHEDESALRRFAHEAAYITDPNVVAERAQSEVIAHTGCAFCEIVLEDELGGYGVVDVNDRALVALRATGSAVSLHDVNTALRGERAYPMLVRGRLLGAIVVGPKRSGESYAPDESAAIAEVAHGVGVALDLLGTGRDTAIPRLIDAIASLERSVNAMPDALVARLERLRQAG